MDTAQRTSGERGIQGLPHGSDTALDTSEGTALDVPEVSWVRKRVRRRFANEAAFVQLRSELAAASPEFELLIERVEEERARGTDRTTETEQTGRMDRNAGSAGTEDDETDRNADPATVSLAWAKHGLSLLESARKAIERGDIQEAWRYLHTARRFEVYGLGELDRLRDERDRRSEIQIRAAVVREEALDTLGGWRRRAVTDLLCDDDGNLREGITGSELRAAIRVLHDQYERVYLARGERQRQFNQLVVMGTLSGLALFAFTLVDLLWSGPDAGLLGVLGNFFETPFSLTEAASQDAAASGTAGPIITSPGFAVYMTVAGVMGASLFGMLSLQRQSISTKIPQQVSQLTVTGARGVIGAISALLLYFTLQTPVLDGAILADGVLTPWLMVVIGFAAGYTERLAPTVVDRIASITDSDEPAASGPVDGAGTESRERLEKQPITATR